MTYEEYLKNRRPYQEEGCRLLLEKKHACLFYKPGKGKTYPTIDALRDVAEDIKQKQHRQARILILSTADAIRNMWEVEIVPQNILPENVVIMTLTQAIQEKTKPKLLSIRWDIVIVDECHKIKANSTKTSKIVYQLTKNAEYAWGLTGTPRGNNDIDIFCQFHNLNVSDWGRVSYSKFTETCCVMESRFFGSNFFKVPVGIKKEYKAGWERQIAMYSHRVDYEEEDSMPELNIKEIKLPFKKTPEYKLAEEGAISLPEYSTTMTKLTAISKMHQIANGYVYMDERQIKYLYHNIKLDWLMEYCSLHDKFVIVYRFIADLDKIQETLTKLGYTFTEDVETFKKDTNCRVLLLQCSRCESFNLQMCNDIVFYTLDYSFIKYDQMLHRLWRMGQTKPVNVNVLLFDGSVENKIWDIVKNKQKLADLFMAIKGA